MYDTIPIRYISPVFRPPSEAQSLILPVTNGCSWNQCTYCEMYTAPQKKFAVRDEQETLESIARCAAEYPNEIQRVFLGDGDAFALSTRRLMTILTAIQTAGRGAFSRGVFAAWELLNQAELFAETIRETAYIR